MVQLSMTVFATGGRAVSEPNYSQRARSVCVSLMSAFFITGRLPWQPDGIKFIQWVNCQKPAFSPLQEKLRVGSKNRRQLF